MCHILRNYYQSIIILHFQYECQLTQSIASPSTRKDYHILATGWGKEEGMPFLTTQMGPDPKPFKVNASLRGGDQCGKIPQVLWDTRDRKQPRISGYQPMNPT